MKKPYLTVTGLSELITDHEAKLFGFSYYDTACVDGHTCTLLRNKFGHMCGIHHGESWNPAVLYRVWEHPGGKLSFTEKEGEMEDKLLDDVLPWKSFLRSGSTWDPALEHATLQQAINFAIDQTMPVLLVNVVTGERRYYQPPKEGGWTTIRQGD